MNRLLQNIKTNNVFQRLLLCTGLVLFGLLDHIFPCGFFYYGKIAFGIGFASMVVYMIAVGVVYWIKDDVLH